MSTISTISVPTSVSEACVVPCVQHRADRHRPRPKPDRILLASRWVRAIIYVAMAGYGFLITR